MMTNIDKKKLKMLIGTSEWETVYPFMDFMFEKWHDFPLKADTDFQTLWNLAYQQGKIEGVKEFINNLEQIAND